MKKSVKLFILLILMLMLCVGVAACNFGSGNTNENGKPEGNNNTNPAYLTALFLKEQIFRLIKALVWATHLSRIYRALRILPS